MIFETHIISYKNLDLIISGFHSPLSLPIFSVEGNNNYIGHPEMFEINTIIWENKDVTNLLEVFSDQIEMDELEQLILKIRNVKNRK